MWVSALLLLALAAPAPAPAPAATPARQDEAPVAVAENASLPHLALDPDGGAVVAFFRNGNVEVALSTDGGKTWSAPVTAIDANRKAGGTYQRGPRVAVDKQKRLYVTAPLALDPKAPDVNDLYLAVSTDRGKTFSKPARLNDMPGAASDSLHWAAVTPAGELHVAWLDGRKGHALHHAKTADQAKKTPKSAPLAPRLCERCAPALAVDAKGTPVFAFRDAPEKKSRQVFFLAGPAAKPLQVNSVDTRLLACPQDAPAVAVSADGRTAAVAWMDTRDGETDPNVYWTLQKDGKFLPEHRANDLGNYYQGHPTIALDAQGAAWFAWEDGRHGTQRIYASNSINRVNVSVTGEKDPRGSFPSIAAQGSFVAVAFGLGDHVAFRALSRAP